MAIPAASTIAAQIVTALAIPGPAQAAARTAWTSIIDNIITAVKAGTITVPGTGLVAPGGAGGPVTGASVSGSIA